MASIWKLLTNHDTILSRVFKAKYYLKEGFLDVKLGHNPSYVWCNIHASQVIVRRGLRWRVGNGTNINIWRDTWLRNNQPYITTPMAEGKENMKVSYLSDHSTGTWNREIINQTFNPRDSSEILKLPLNLIQSPDVPTWNLSTNEIYSVQSAYFHLMEVIIDNNHLKVEGNLQRLWKLQVPNKIKIFLW
jgi:hypothetical protein